MGKQGAELLRGNAVLIRPLCLGRSEGGSTEGAPSLTWRVRGPRKSSFEQAENKL